MVLYVSNCTYFLAGVFLRRQSCGQRPRDYIHERVKIRRSVS
ncbi:hypothetical protein GBAR_LOCUS7769 [Geodia barretti]|uniref:Uncharacterized protein n=1 Tax=Geodia barretti TaxID=519541 RepID=A0AA35RK69_GEOBA|nr:hypothetical protein GBAR_LOCUS7769 [Geodia barretti]